LGDREKIVGSMGIGDTGIKLEIGSLNKGHWIYSMPFVILFLH